MIDSIAEALSISRTGAGWLLAAVAVQVVVMAWALVDLARRPRVRYDKKWIWALAIIFLSNSFIGPILYVALGRNVPEEIDVRPDSAGEGAAGEGAGGSERTRRAVDALYGDKSGE